RQLLDALGVLRRKIVAQLDGDAAVFGVDENGVLWIGAGRQLLREQRGRPNQKRKQHEQSGHGTSGTATRAGFASPRRLISHHGAARTIRICASEVSAKTSASGAQRPTAERIATRRRPSTRFAVPACR